MVSGQRNLRPFTGNEIRTCGFTMIPAGPFIPLTEADAGQPKQDTTHSIRGATPTNLEGCGLTPESRLLEARGSEAANLKGTAWAQSTPHPEGETATSEGNTPGPASEAPS